MVEDKEGEAARGRRELTAAATTRCLSKAPNRFKIPIHISVVARHRLAADTSTPPAFYVVVILFHLEFLPTLSARSPLNLTNSPLPVLITFRLLLTLFKLLSIPEHLDTTHCKNTSIVDPQQLGHLGLISVVDCDTLL